MNFRALVDTSAILLVGMPPVRPPAEYRMRLACAQETIANLEARGCEFWVPTIALAELSHPNADKLVEAVLGRLGIRICNFDRVAAKAAREMRAGLKKGAAEHATKRELKFDTLIAASAHSIGAAQLVTADSRGFQGFLTKIGSSVQVLLCDRPNEFLAQLPLALPVEGTPTGHTLVTRVSNAPIVANVDNVARDQEDE